MSEVTNSQENSANSTESNLWSEKMADVPAFEAREATLESNKQQERSDFQARFDALTEEINRLLTTLNYSRKYNPTLPDMFIAKTYSESKPENFDQEVLTEAQSMYEYAKDHTEQFTQDELDIIDEEYQYALELSHDIKQGSVFTENIEADILAKNSELNQLIDSNLTEYFADLRLQSKVKLIGEEVFNIKLKREVYTHVDFKSIEQNVFDAMSGIRLDDILQLEKSYQEHTKKEADANAVAYFSELYGLENAPKIEYYGEGNEESKGRSGCYHRENGCIYLDPKVTNPDSCLDTICHECFHAKQWHDTQTQHNYNGFLKIYNFANYIKHSLDYNGYFNQLVESEAYISGYSFLQLLHVARGAEELGVSDSVSNDPTKMQEVIRRAVHLMTETFSANVKDISPPKDVAETTK